MSLAGAAGKCIEISRMSQVTGHTIKVQVVITSNTSSHTFFGSVSLWCDTSRVSSASLDLYKDTVKKVASSLDLYKDTKK
jgi:hypothetical protein